MVHQANDDYNAIMKTVYDLTLDHMSNKVEITDEDELTSTMTFTTPAIHRLSKFFEYDPDILEWKIELDPHHSSLEYPCFTLYYKTYNTKLREYLHIYITDYHKIECRTRKISSDQAYIFSRWLDKSGDLNVQSANHILREMKSCVIEVKRIDGYIDSLIEKRDFVQMKKNLRNYSTTLDDIIIRPVFQMNTNVRQI